jgi:predicted TIM-barrel fold metal-dependent hydrolase
LESRFDAASYLRAMDAEGIDACVLYPSQGLFAPFQPQLDAAQSALACRAYNDWVAGYCGADRQRLFGAAVVPLADPVAAAHEVHRAAAMGLVAVMVRPNHLYSRNLGDADYDPLYDAVAEAQMMLAVHEGLGLRGPTVGSDRFETFAERHVCSHPMEQMMAMASLVIGGALERHPAMRVAYLESGTGWLPYWLSRLDGHTEWMAVEECAHLSLTPSEYFARQCVISTDSDDELAAWVTARVGADHVMWASDFPHPDALYPHAVETFVHEMAETGMNKAVLDAVFWDTPVDFYRLLDRVGPSRS